VKIFKSNSNIILTASCQFLIYYTLLIFNSFEPVVNSLHFITLRNNSNEPIKRSPPFLETEPLLTCAQEPGTSSYSETIEPDERMKNQNGQEENSSSS
jgi:hypothetical protein